MKIKLLILTLAVGLFLLGGCATKAPDASTSPAASDATATEEATASPEESTEASPETSPEVSDPGADVPDVVSTATAQVAKDDATLVKALGKSGSWIIIFNTNVTTSSDLVIEGSFKDGRKLALYSQDEARKILASYTLTAPKLTIKSENTKIQNGTFKGDVYVQAKGFTIVGGKVDGNVYFASDAIKASFVMGKGGSITGAQEVKQ